MHQPLGIPEAHLQCGPLPPQLSQTRSPGLAHWQSLQMALEHPLCARPMLRTGARRCGQFTSIQERAQTQRTDTHSKLREVRAREPAGRGPPALFIGPKEPTQKGGVRGEPAGQASVREAGETGCKGRRQQPLCTAKACKKKKKSQLFVYTRRQSRTTSGWQVWGAGSRSEELQARLCSPVTHPVGEPECEGSLPTPRSL